MSTGAIIGLIVLALIVIAAFIVMSKFSKTRQREREIERRNKAIEERREQVVTEERSAAEERQARADRAEQMARMERAAAEQHQARAEMHREGHLDEELARDVDGDGVADTGEQQPGRRSLRSEDDATIGEDTGTAGGTQFDRGRRFEREQLAAEEEQSRLRNK
jgi:Flp pilus assembly protein TadB